MKQWQEKIPTLNLVLVNFILIILIMAGFIVGPINRLSNDKNEVLLALKEKVQVDSCFQLDSYTFDKELFTAKCVVNNADYYLFIDKNGIVYDRMMIDNQKEQEDFVLIIDKYEIDKASFMVIYYNNDIAYWVKSKEFEYILSYESLEVIMKVRF